MTKRRVKVTNVPAKPVDDLQFSILKRRNNFSEKTVTVPPELVGKVNLSMPTTEEVKKYIKMTNGGDPLANITMSENVIFANDPESSVPVAMAMSGKVVERAPLKPRDQGEILPPRQRALSEDNIGTSDRIVYPSIYDVIHKNDPNVSGFTYELEQQEEIDNAREFFDKKWREAKANGNEIMAMMYRQGRDSSYGKMGTKIIRRSVR